MDAPHQVQEHTAIPIEQKLRRWIFERRERAGAMPRRYATLNEAIARMCAANPRLTEVQARFLSRHGSLQNEDGTFSWKFDSEIRFHSPLNELAYENQYWLWSRITYPRQHRRVGSLGAP